MTPASYFGDLCARLWAGERETLQFLDVRDQIPEWERNKCHRNVAGFLASHSEYRAVRGWAVSAGFVLDAHSVVIDANGTLWDITFPDPTQLRVVFLRHRGTEEYLQARAYREQHL